MRGILGWSRRMLALCLLGLPALAPAQSYVKAFDPLTFTRPVWMGEIPGKPDCFLVLQQVGNAQAVRQVNGQWTKSAFVTIPVEGGKDGGNEQGLLGFAFHPDYAHNRKYYVYYIAGDSDRVDERTADTTLLKDSGSDPRHLIGLPDPESNHNGGSLAFGKDGFLYIGIGDGGGGGDQHEPPNGQNKNTLFGKFLRIDVNTKVTGKQYGIPSDNPFASGGGAPEIYAYGMRNPWKWSFDPENGDLWAGDVGQDMIEEVDIIKKGLNYGWNQVEGNRCFTPNCTMPNFQPPVYTYDRSKGYCVIGGVVYRGNAASPYYGSFIFGDYGSSNMWSVTSKGVATSLAKIPGSIGLSSFAVDGKLQVYVMGVGASFIYRMSGSGWDAAGTSLTPGKGSLSGKTGRTFSVAPGTRLDLSAFGPADELAVYSLGGARAASLTRAAREIPAGFPSGVYLLKSAAGKPDVLVVR
jgi:glucose/arabinose dehydrogenase